MEQLIPEIITASVSVAVSYGVMRTEIKHLKQKIDKYEDDHDLVIRIDAKVDNLADMMKEMKTIMEKRSKK